MPIAPSDRSADSRASTALTSAGAAGRCQAGVAMLPRNTSSLPSSAIPATASIRASAQDVANP